MTVLTELEVRTLASTLERLGDVPPERVYTKPAFGTATVADVVNVHARTKRLCELVDGILVEKPMGAPESLLACELIFLIKSFLRENPLGVVLGEAGMLRLGEDLVRIPDIAFFSWERLPEGRFPTEAVPEITPDLAIEVLSPSNTEAEMARKRAEYFDAGTVVVWEINPRSRTLTEWTSATEHRSFGESDIVATESVLPGFNLSLAELFAQLDQQSPE